MTMPALPDAGSTAWYGHYAALHARGSTVVAPTLVADGTTDDAPALQAALDAAPAGSTIVLPSGKIALGSTVTVSKHSTTLRGQGTGARGNASQTSPGTTLVARTGFSGTAQGNSAGAVLRFSGGGTSPLHGCGLSDLTVDGASLGTSIDGVHWRSHTSHVDNVHIWRSTGDGFRLQGYTSGSEGAASTWATYDSIFSRLIIGYAGGTSFNFDSAAQDCHLFGSVFMYPTVDNIRVAAGSQQITACHTYSGGRYNVFFSGGSRTKITNLKCEQAYQHGICFDTVGGSDVMISASNFKNNGHSADNTYDHIHVPTGTTGWSRCSFTGLNFSVAADASEPNYDANRARSAVYLGSSSREPLVANLQVGSGHVRTARVVDNAPTTTGNRTVSGIGSGLAYVTNPDGTRTYTGGTTRPTSMLAGDFWLHDA